MRHNEILDTLQNLTNERPKQRQLAEALQMPINTIGNRAVRNSQYTTEEIQKISDYFKCDILREKWVENKICESYIKDEILCDKVLEITYRPDVYLSAGYGVEVFNEEAEKMLLDERLFYTDRGIKINPATCEIVNVSGNSMSPEYKHGDRVIIDKSVNNFIDGYIFAFRYNGECFMKEICLMGKRIKCIPLNKEYEPFYIEPDEEYTVFGRILPRVRL